MKLPFKESAWRRLPWEVGRGSGSGRASGRVGWAGLRVGPGSGRARARPGLGLGQVSGRVNCVEAAVMRLPQRGCLNEPPL